MANIDRGDVWLVSLDPTEGREIKGQRPALVISVDQLNNGPAEIVVIIPISSKYKGIPLHVEVKPPEGGLTCKSYVKCEDIRSVSTKRLKKHLGAIKKSTISSIEDKLRILLSL